LHESKVAYPSYNAALALVISTFLNADSSAHYTYYSAHKLSC